MSTPQNEVETEETSGVTTLMPVLAKPARLFELAEEDSTAYFSASELLARGKALGAHTSGLEPQPEAAQVAAAPEPPPRKHWLTQFRRASLARKVSVILLPLLCAVLLLKPLLIQSRPLAASAPLATARRSVIELAKPASPPPLARVESLSLPRGVTAEHAAADSVATGDFARAAALYRELSRREPRNQAYREAARILSVRASAATP